MPEINDVQHGDHVKVVKDGKEFFGVLMPSSSSYVVIKLENGYNVGFAPEGLRISVVKRGVPATVERHPRPIRPELPSRTRRKICADSL